VGDILNYFSELKRAMEYLASYDRTIFLGQCVEYPGNAIFKTVCDIDKSKRLELPVMEDCQMGISIGLALKGFIPITIYPRWNFLALSTNQIVNHLDKYPEMTAGRVNPKVIIRVCVGSTKPLYPGSQHCSDFTESYKTMLTNIDVIKLVTPVQIFESYKKAIKSDRSTILVELADLYDKEEVKTDEK
jgi:pyruvate/2-oxoglutarate/acetoin dehydrogenase E1 component